MTIKTDPDRATRQLVIPKGCRPSRALSTDESRPVLCSAYIRQHEGKNWLMTTDSRQATAIEVHDDLAQGFVPREVLTELERGRRIIQTDDGWRIELATSYALFTSDASGTFPDFTQLRMWSWPKTEELNLTAPIGMSTKLLRQVSDALGTEALEYTITDPLRTVHLRPANLIDSPDRRALLMPIRIH